MSKLTSTLTEINDDIVVMNFTIVNAFLVGNKNDFILVDTGLENSYNYIIKAINQTYGENSKPKAIILTHGHFDHVGSIKKLIDLWNIPVYIHKLEIPYVTGKKDFPKGDPSVDKGMVAKISPSFPHSAIDISNHVFPLPDDNSIPHMLGWKWIYTPGHTEGHVSLFRESDRTLIVGDAFAATKQESLLHVMLQKEEISGPPKYLTTDWQSAKQSVSLLKNLKPLTVLPSHGHIMKGNEIDEHLDLLIDEFNLIAKTNESKFLNDEL